ncbi:hypothetical protein M9Y10_002081 [Tritrichomonas musculus]|uniref:DUF3447 domain-containing protein n=1 Tax=Tritrichomonas musculus TaxID=1915356 RepID=A0ABR2GNG1_9EUKA
MFGFLLPNAQSSLQIIDSVRNPGRIDSKTTDNFLLSSQFQILNSTNLLEVLSSYPKDFKITNQGKEYYFSSPVIRDLSAVINKLPAEVKEFSIDINDPFDSMQKFADVLVGKTSSIEIKQERPFFKKLAQILQVNLPPTISATYNLKINYQSPYSSKILKMAILPLSIQNLSQKNPRTFTIFTNNNNYSCNCLTVALSGKIAAAITENPELNEFRYEIDDPTNQFQIFCDFFNFVCCQITSQNIDFIEKVAYDLDIKLIQKKITEYRKKFDDGQKILDIEQDQIELVTTLQEQLFNLTDNTLDATIENLEMSIWLKDPERIKEFSSNLAIVATYRPQLHPVLIEFIRRISEKVPDFLPFFKPYVMFLSVNSLGSFIYQMYKSNLIELDTILENIWENITFDPVEDRSSVTTQLFLWFLPELDSKFPFIIENISIRGDAHQSSFILERNLETYKMNDWHIYKEMRDNIYNSDPFAIAIVNDDTDKFQELLSAVQFDMSHKIQPSIFENFEPMYFIDYAALHSSVACFKYMMLNHAEITPQTLVNAIKGGNTEIIRVSEMANSNDWQTSLQNNMNNNMNNNNNFLFMNRVMAFAHNANFFFNDNAVQTSPGFAVFKEAVQYHRYGIFEWLMQTMTDQTSLIRILQSCMLTVILTNNIVSLMSIIDSGVNLTSKNPNLNNSLRQNAISAASRGYSDLLKIILALTDKSIFVPSQLLANQATFGMNLTQQKLNQMPKTVLEAASSFGSLRIIKMMIAARYDKPISSAEIESSLIAAASRGHLDVIKLWIEVLRPPSSSEAAGSNLNLKETTNDSNDENIIDNDNYNENDNNDDFGDKDDNEDKLYDTEQCFRKAATKIGNMNIEISSKTFTKLIQKAVYFGHIDILKYFISREDCDWTQILESASQHGQLEIVKYIIETKFAQKDESNKELKFNQAFCLAAQNGFFDVCNFFAENHYLSLNVDQVGGILGEIASKGYIDILKLIFKLIPGESCSKLNNKYLNSAIENGQIVVASLFIRLGGAQCDTLIKASRKGLFEIVKLLCDNPEYRSNEKEERSNDNHNNNNNNNNSDDNSDSSQLYINNVTMHEGSALCAAASSGSLETVEYLLKQPGIDLNLYNSMHETAIIIAARYKHFQIMKTIINAYSEEQLRDQMWQINSAFVAYFNFKPTSSLSNVGGGRIFDFVAPRQVNFFHGNKRNINDDRCIEKVEFEYDILNYFLSFTDINANFLFDGVTPLIAAINQQNIDCVSVMIKSPEIDVNFPDKSGKAPLMAAVLVGNLKLVELLLSDDRVDVNYTNSSNESALSISAHGANIGDRIAVAITNSANFEADLPNTNIALMSASIFGIGTIFAHLMTLNFDVNRKVPSANKIGTFENILYTVCVWNGEVEHNLPLILNHPRFDPDKNDLVSCLFGLCRQNELTPFNSVLNLLNDDVNLRNNQGTTLLVESIKMRTDTIAQAIMGNPNFDPYLSDVKTAFAYSLSVDSLLISLLIDQPGIDINEPIYLYHPFTKCYYGSNGGYDGYTGIGNGMNDNNYMFFMNENEDVYFEDIGEGQIDNAFNITLGHTPLAIACQNPQLLEPLLNHEGIDVNRKCDDGSAPIFEAVIIQNSLSLEALLRRPEIDLNIQNNDGMTPLIFSLANQISYSVSLLLTKDNIDLTIKDNDGLTAFDYLVRNYGLIRDDIVEPKTPKEFLKLYNVACQLCDYDNSGW